MNTAHVPPLQASHASGASPADASASRARVDTGEFEQPNGARVRIAMPTAAGRAAESERDMPTRMPSQLRPDEPPLRACFDRFELDEADARLTIEGRPVPLPPRPFAVLCALARAPQTLLTTNALLDRVWGHRFVSESVLKTAISDLRAALQDDPRNPRYIETVSRRGYRFVATLRVPSLPRLPMPVGPGPAMPAPASPPIGRADELGRLRSAWQAATAGRRQIVWIAGEAGVGKTTLIEHLLGEIGVDHCAHGQCVEQQGAGEPFHAVLEALAALSRRDAALAELIRGVAPTWLLRFPWLSSPDERETLRRELSSSSQVRMLREMGELLDRYTEDRPLLLVTEDLQWSDRATVELINYIARRRGGARLLWLASFRPTEVIATDHPLNSMRPELRLHGLCEEIVLDSFSEAEVAQFVADRVPTFAVDETFVRALHDRTDGLPLFVAVAVDELVARGATDPAKAMSPCLHSACPIPEGFAGLVEQYLEQLRPDQRLVLQAASVCGLEFGLATVAHLLGADVASVARACMELVHSRRWLKDAPAARHEAAHDARYAFRHRLYREVLYQRIGQLARLEFHRRLQAWLARVDPIAAPETV